MSEVKDESAYQKEDKTVGIPYIRNQYICYNELHRGKPTMFPVS